MIGTLIAIVGTLLLITAGNKAPRVVPQPVRPTRRR